MESSYLILVLAFSLSVSVAVMCVALLLMTRRTRATVSRGLEATKVMDQRLSLVEQRLKNSVQQVSDQGRRVAWLELKYRQVQNVHGQSQAANNDDEPNFASMTERRHRVMVLARRGLDIDQIAEMLSVPQGEVELILSLNAMQGGR